jgi:transcription elongation factor Elf1
MPELTDYCPECGEKSLVCTNDPANYQVLNSCSACGYEGKDYYEDLYGCMSVPWGYLL